MKGPETDILDQGLKLSFVSDLPTTTVRLCGGGYV